MSEWDNVKRVAEPAGLKYWGYGPILDKGEEVWFRIDGGIAIGRETEVIPPIDDYERSLVHERVALFDERACLYVEAERRGEHIVVRRGLLNGSFHESAADEPLESLVERYTRLGFKPGFGWNLRQDRTVLREFRSPTDQRNKRTVYVDGAHVNVRNVNMRDYSSETHTHEAANRDEAIAWAEAELVKWQLEEDYALVLVEDTGSSQGNPMPAWEAGKPVRPEPETKPVVEWQAEPLVLALDIEAAAQTAPPTLMDVEPELDELVDLDPAVPVDEHLREMESSLPSNLVVFAEAIRRAVGPTAASHTVAGSWNPADEANVVVGDLVIEGDCDPGVPVIVTGNLVVHGRLNQDTGAPVIVLGDVHAHQICTGGTLVIGGDCDVDGVVFGHYNDEVLEIHGHLRAGALITDEHMIVIAGETHLRHRPSTNGAWGEETFDKRNSSHTDELLALLGEDLYDPAHRAWDWSVVPSDF